MAKKKSKTFFYLDNDDGELLTKIKRVLEPDRGKLTNMAVVREALRLMWKQVGPEARSDK